MRTKQTKQKPKMRVDLDGAKYWYLKGQLHREDGPAIEWADGSKKWFLHGMSYPTSSSYWLALIQLWEKEEK